MQTIIRVEKTENYSVISNHCINDNNLSWKAKGLLVFLLSRPNNWRIYLEDLKKRSADGLTATQTGVNELITAGYIKRTRLHNTEDGPDKGKFLGYSYTVYEHQANSLINKPCPGNPETVNPETGNQQLLNTEHELNTDLTKPLLSKDSKSLRPHLNKNSFELLLKYMPAKKDNATKTQLHIEKNLDALVKHTFFEKNFFKPEYLAQHKHSAELLNNIDSWEQLDKALKIAMKRLEEAREPGNFPADKSTLPRDLYTFLYNTRTGKSWFMYFLTNKTKTQEQPAIEQTWAQLPEKERAAAQAFRKKLHPAWDEQTFAGKAVKTAAWLKTNIESVYSVPGANYLFGNLGLLLERFVEFEAAITTGAMDFKGNVFGPESSFWNQHFLPWLKREYNINMPRKAA